MYHEIVLKAGQKTILVSEIADLIANAIHPLPPEGRTEIYLNMLSEAEREHRSALMANIRYGNLIALSPKTNQPTDENNPKGYVTVEAFARYVADFGIAVRFAANESQD